MIYAVLACIGVTVWAVVTAVAATRKVRRLARASVLRRIEDCNKRHCTCVK